MVRMGVLNHELIQLVDKTTFRNRAGVDVARKVNFPCALYLFLLAFDYHEGR